MADIQNDIQDFNNLHPNRKLAVFGIVLFAFVLSVVVGIYFSKAKKSTETMKKDAMKETGTTMLTLVPASETVKVGDKVKVSVMLSGEAVAGADIVVQYDPAYFAVSQDDLLVGSAFKTLPYAKIQNGKIIVTALVDLANPSDIKTGEVVSFNLEALKTGSSKLSFDTEDTQDVQKTITSKVGGIDTLKSAQGTSITIE